MMGYLTGDAGYWDAFWLRTIMGFSMGFLFVPLTTAALAEIPRAEMSNATGIYTLVRQLGGSLGIAMMQFIEQRRESAAYTSLAGGVSIDNPNISAILHGLPNPAAALAQLAASVRLNAMTIAYDDAFRLFAILFIVAIPSVFLLRSRRSAAAKTAAFEQ